MPALKIQRAVGHRTISLRTQHVETVILDCDAVGAAENLEVLRLPIDVKRDRPAVGDVDVLRRVRGVRHRRSSC